MDYLEQLIEDFAEKYYEWQEYVSKRYKTMTEEQLLQIDELCKTRISNFHQTIAKEAIYEIFFRKNIKLARELDSDCFCIYHQCDSKCCPDDGTHTDD